MQRPEGPDTDARLYLTGRSQSGAGQFRIRNPPLFQFPHQQPLRLRVGLRQKYPLHLPVPEKFPGHFR